MSQPSLLKLYNNEKKNYNSQQRVTHYEYDIDYQWENSHNSAFSNNRNFAHAAVNLSWRTCRRAYSRCHCRPSITNTVVLA